jgi:membrane protease YdiL (CAAX protease family)
VEKTSKTPFIIFIIAFIITATVLVIASFYPILGWDKKYLSYLAFAQMWVAILSPIGIFSAYKERKKAFSKIKKAISLYGNIVLFIYTLGLMIYPLTLIK